MSTIVPEALDARRRLRAPGGGEEAPPPPGRGCFRHGREPRTLNGLSVAPTENAAVFALSGSVFAPSIHVIREEDVERIGNVETGAPQPFGFHRA